MVVDARLLTTVSSSEEPEAVATLTDSITVGVKLVGTSLVKIMLLVAPPGSLVSCSAG